MAVQLRRLEYFVAVAEELSFSQAARRLHIAQPPLSNQVKKLETELGVVLFERTSRGVLLTDAGELLLEEARRILLQVEQTVAVVRRVGRGEVGRLTVGFVPSASNSVLPPILQRFRQRSPGVELFLRELRPDLVVAALQDQQIDAGLLFLPLAAAERGGERRDADHGRRPEAPGLRAEVVSREPLVIALPEGHRLAGQAEIDLADLAGEPFVLPKRYQGMPGLYGQVVDLCRRAGFTPEAVQKDVWLMQTIVGLVAGGTGVALVPESVRAALGREGVVYKPVKGSAPTVELGLLWRAGDQGPVLQAFLDVARPQAGAVSP
jgi:DNA-binding transcriptional LysR family regulator